MADTVESNTARIEKLEGLIEQLTGTNEALREDLTNVAGIVHDLTKLLMQDKTVPALTAHRGKWKTVLEKLEVIILQEEVDAEN